MFRVCGPSQLSRRYCCQFIEELSCLREIRSVESFCEPTVYSVERLRSVRVLPLFLPQLGETHRGSQLVGFCVPLVCQIEGLVKAGFSFASGGLNVARREQ